MGGGSEEGDPPADGWIKEEKKEREDRERGGTRPAWSPAPPVTLIRNTVVNRRRLVGQKQCFCQINVVTPTLMKLIIS